MNGDSQGRDQSHAEPEAVSFDLFGTLVAVDAEESTQMRLASALRCRDVPVPDDWRRAYAEVHLDVQPGRELSLPRHVRAALESRGVDVDEKRREHIQKAVLDAFDCPTRTRDGARETVERVARAYPVGILSNCSVPGLVEQTIEQSAFERSTFDSVVSSVDCGWRKPDRRAFTTIADELDTAVDSLVHVGDDPDADGGARVAGATAILLDDTPITAVPGVLEGCP